MKPINEMTLEELAEHAVTLDGWERIPGMVLSHNWGRVIAVDGQRFRTVDGWWERGNAYCYPDLTDPATLGCVLAMTRKKHGPLSRAICSDIYKWGFVSGRFARHYTLIDTELQTEAHALIAALAKEVGR